MSHYYLGQSETSLRIKCHIVKKTLLQTAFFCFCPLGCRRGIPVERPFFRESYTHSLPATSLLHFRPLVKKPNQSSKEFCGKCDKHDIQKHCYFFDNREVKVKANLERKHCADSHENVDFDTTVKALL